MRLEKIVAKALKSVDGDRYLLSAVVFKRVDELSRGAKPLIEADTKKQKLTDIALLEIANGKIDLSKIKIINK